MKLYLAILLISFILIEAHGSRVKRGLSADEQKKFLDELNKDRKEIAQKGGFKFVPMIYDASLENKIVTGKECQGEPGVLPLPLRLNDVAEKMWKYYLNTNEGNIYKTYFDPNFNKIGCSKEAKCSNVLKNDKYHDAPPALEGETIEYYGLCVLGSSEETVGVSIPQLKHANAPSPNKYADILGVVAGSGTGRTFSLIISLFLVLYI